MENIFETEEICKECNGYGSIIITNGTMNVSTKCPLCKGNGIRYWTDIIKNGKILKDGIHVTTFASKFKKLIIGKQDGHWYARYKKR